MRCPPGPCAGRIRGGRASERRRVGAEDVLHGPAHLSERCGVLRRLADRGQQVLAAAGRLPQLLETSRHESLVAVGLELLQATNLLALGLRVDAEQIRNLDVLLLEGVDADDDVLLDAVPLLVAPGR